MHHWWVAAPDLGRAGAADGLVRGVAARRCRPSITPPWSPGWRQSWTALLLILFVLVAAWHSQLGVRVVVEDYVHGSGLKHADARAGHLRARVRGGGRRVRGPEGRIRGRRMSAYEFIDHTYDVIVVGAGGAGLRATLGLAESGAVDRLHHQAVSDAQPHRRRPGRHQRRARQHGRGRLALAHVRHREGFGLAGRPGRHRVHVQGSARARSSSSSTTACRSRAPRRGASTSARSAA